MKYVLVLNLDAKLKQWQNN